MIASTRSKFASVDVSGDARVIGDEQENWIYIDWLGGVLEFEGGEGIDVVFLYYTPQLTGELTGYTQAEFELDFAVTADSSGALKIFEMGSGALRFSLFDVEEIAFRGDRDGTWFDYVEDRVFGLTVGKVPAAHRLRA